MDINFLVDAMENVGFNTIVMENEMDTQETMMSKLGDAFEIAKLAVTNQFSLRDKLEETEAAYNRMQQQFKELQFTVEGWDERAKLSDQHLNEARRQRNDANQRIGELELENAKLRNQIAVRERDSDHWQQEYNRVNEEGHQLQSQLRALEEDHLKLMEQHEVVKSQLKKVQDIFAAPMSEGTEEPPAAELFAEHVVEATTEKVDQPDGEMTKSDEGEKWPSMDQPRDDKTGWFKPYEKKSEVN